MTLDVNARATEAGALLEWQALTPLMRDAIRGARPCHGGRTIHDHGVNGAVVAGLRSRQLLGLGSELTARGSYVRDVGKAWENKKENRT